MCGIAGIIYKNGNGEHRVGHDMTRMLQSMKHRGPDSTGYALFGPPSKDFVVRIKLALYDGSLPSGAAMQQLIQLMRRDAAWPGAKELYQEASTSAYQTRQSSVSHSHPPPPVARKP